MILAHQLIAAKLNVANGSDPAPVTAGIEGADALLSGFPDKLPYRVKMSTAPGQEMVNQTSLLRDYNHGNITPGCGL